MLQMVNGFHCLIPFLFLKSRSNEELMDSWHTSPRTSFFMFLWPTPLWRKLQDKQSSVIQITIPWLTHSSTCSSIIHYALNGSLSCFFYFVCQLAAIQYTNLIRLSELYSALSIGMFSLLKALIKKTEANVTDHYNYTKTLMRHYMNMKVIDHIYSIFDIISLTLKRSHFDKKKKLNENCGCVYQMAALWGS